MRLPRFLVAAQFALCFAALVAAVSVGIVAGEARVDLAYAEDRVAQVDANVVVAEPVIGYCVALVHATRANPQAQAGASPRGVEALVAVAQPAAGAAAQPARE